MFLSSFLSSFLRSFVRSSVPYPRFIRQMAEGCGRVVLPSSDRCQQCARYSGVSRGVFWLPGNPPPQAMIFFKQGVTPLLTPTFTSHLNLRLLETPPDTTSGYATALQAYSVDCTTTLNDRCAREACSFDGKLVDDTLFAIRQTTPTVRTHS